MRIHLTPDPFPEREGEEVGLVGFMLFWLWGLSPNPFSEREGEEVGLTGFILFSSDVQCDALYPFDGTLLTFFNGGISLIMGAPPCAS